MKFGFVHALGAVFVFIGKLFVCALTGVLGYLLIEFNSSLKDKLYSKIVPVFIFILVEYFISSLFFSVYGVAADAILLCFFMDKEISSKGGRPVNAPPPMTKFYEKYRKTK